MTFEDVLVAIKNKGLDPYNLSHLLNELKAHKVHYSRNDIENHLSSHQLFNYHSTQNDVAWLMAKIGSLYKPEKLADISCGLGNIMVHCNYCTSTGFDIDKNIIDIADFISPEIKFINTNSLELSDEEKYDAIISHFPYGKVQINGRKDELESAFITKGLKLLKAKGVLICLVPERLLFGNTKTFSELRRTVVENNHLKTVISFEPGFFEATGIKRSILVIEKEYSSEATQFIKHSTGTKTLEKLSNKNGDFFISKDQLTSRWDYHFHSPEYKKHEEQLSIQETKRMDDLVEIIIGTPLKASDKLSVGNLKVITPRNVASGTLDATETDNYLKKSELNTREEKAILKYGDIILPRFYRDKIDIYIHTEAKQEYIANSNLIILRGKNAEYVAIYLNTEKGIDLFNQQIRRHSVGNVIPVISLKDLKNIQIPILPIQDLELASKNKLEKLSYGELMNIKVKYDSLKSRYEKLEERHKVLDHEAQLNSMQEVLQEVLRNQRVMSTKLDEIKSTLQELSEDFKEIKNLPRDIDEKISRFNTKLDKKLEELLQNQKELDFYILEIKRWFDYYDILESKSQKYLPEAEYILDHISKLENPDYSPFILQYCRALENELLKKIFRAYVQSLIDRNINLEKDFAWDFGRKESGKLNNDDTYKLGRHLQKCLKKPEDNWFFELGSMEVNLRRLTGKTVKKSPLLQDLKFFVLKRFKQELLNVNYLDEIRIIITDYRNQSAHPNLIDTEQAVEFHKQMKECLISLMENYIQQR